MPGPKSKANLMIVAGEPSGDAHAAALVQALKESGHMNFFGATGPLMRAAGVDSIVHSDELAIVGLLEIGGTLNKFWQAYRALKQSAAERKPDAVILVDWPDFNFRLARFLHARGFKIIYFISPQLWAWRPHRIRNIKRDVDLLLTILPFEPQWYAARGVTHVDFVGHPLAGAVNARYDRAEFCQKHGLEQGKPILSLLPGSRRKEFQRILPAMLDAVSLLKPQHPDVQFVLVVAPSRSEHEADQLLSTRSDAAQLRSILTFVSHETREALAASDAAAIASGTATLEAALLGTPMVIVYKESATNWHTLGRLITAEHFGLPNLIAGRRIVTELMQNDLNGASLARELSLLLEPARNAAMRQQLDVVRESLGHGGASQRAAERIVAALREWTTSP